MSQCTTLISLLGLCSKRLTPTYSVNGKVTFEKWVPHHDLIHWLTMGRRAFPPGRLCDLDWDYTSVWIFSHSPTSLLCRQCVMRVLADIQINSISPHAEGEGGRSQGSVRTNPAGGLFSHSWPNNKNTLKICRCWRWKHWNKTRQINYRLLESRQSFLFEVFAKMCARCCLFKINYQAATAWSIEEARIKEQ